MTHLMGVLQRPAETGRLDLFEMLDLIFGMPEKECFLLILMYSYCLHM